MTDIVERLRLLAAVDNCQASLEAAAEIERLRAALRAAFDAGSELGWDHATYSERGGPEPIGHEDAFAAFLAALDGQPAPGVFYHPARPDEEACIFLPLPQENK